MKVTICSLVYLFLLSKQAAVKGADEADLSLRGSRQLLQLSITKLQLYNALTGKLITDLSPGQTVIVQGMSSPAFNIKAVVPNGDIKSIRFGLDSNPGYSLKNGSPYSLCGMRSGSNYNVCPELNFNTHTVTAVPFASKNGQGTQGPTVSFSLTISSSSGTTLPPPSVKTPQFANNWSGMDPAYPIPVAESQGTIIGNDLLLVGGFNNGYGQATNQTWAMDTTSSTVLWRQMDDHPIPTGITHASLAIAGTKFYMCGGYVGGDPGQATSLCYVFDHSKAPTTGQWSTFAPLPDVRAGGGLVYNTQRNALYYSGGAMRPQVGVATAVDYNTTWMYSLNNPSAGWVSKAPIPYTANHMSFVSAKDAAGMERHYFLGGQTSSDECCGNHAENYEWDAVNEIWIKRANMPIARGHAASSTRAIGSGFIIAGGTTNVNGKTTDISYYDIPSDTWTSIGNLTYAINTPVCDMAGGTLFCESGWETGYFSWRRQITF